MNHTRTAMTSGDLQLLLTRTMPFGKYKGRAIADLPGHYLNWFARDGFPPGELGRLLALTRELDHNGLSSLLDPLRKGLAARCGIVGRDIPRWRGYNVNLSLHN